MTASLLAPTSAFEPAIPTGIVGRPSDEVAKDTGIHFQMLMIGHME